MLATCIIPIFAIQGMLSSMFWPRTLQQSSKLQRGSSSPEHMRSTFLTQFVLFDQDPSSDLNPKRLDSNTSETYNNTSIYL